MQYNKITLRGKIYDRKCNICSWMFLGGRGIVRTQPGVISTRVGYTGGDTHTPSYEEVCTGKTNHAEAIEITYDSASISYSKLVELFFKNHNPTTKNRQGPDVGTQYRSVIFYHSKQQLDEAAAIKNKLEIEKYFTNPIVTEIIPAQEFYPAEEYHQKYLSKRGRNYC